MNNVAGLQDCRGAAVLQTRAAHGGIPIQGTRDLARLAVLVDALEKAGCTDAEWLNHLRGPDPHVRGCFAVDLLLGKE